MPFYYQTNYKNPKLAKKTAPEGTTLIEMDDDDLALPSEVPAERRYEVGGGTIASAFERAAVPAIINSEDSEAKINSGDQIAFEEDVVPSAPIQKTEITEEPLPIIPADAVPAIIEEEEVLPKEEVPREVKFADAEGLTDAQKETLLSLGYRLDTHGTGNNPAEAETFLPAAVVNETPHLDSKLSKKEEAKKKKRAKKEKGKKDEILPEMIFRSVDTDKMPRKQSPSGKGNNLSATDRRELLPFDAISDRSYFSDAGKVLNPKINQDGFYSPLVLRDRDVDNSHLESYNKTILFIFAGILVAAVLGTIIYLQLVIG